MEEIYLIYVDTQSNSNKFWSGIVNNSGDLVVQWGRVGYKAQSKVHILNSQTHAKVKLALLVAEKAKKGYVQTQREIKTLELEEIKQALKLLSKIEQLVTTGNTESSEFANSANEFLKIVPSPTGMKFNLSSLFQNTLRISHQQQKLEMYLKNKTYSLKSLTEDFWD